MTNAEPERTLRVVADITRVDIFFASFHIMLRQRVLWVLCFIGFAHGLWLQWHSDQAPTHWRHGVYFVAIYGVRWLGVLVVAALITAMVMVFQAASVRGVLGPHTFELRSDGLFESTSANQTLTHWAGIPRATRTARYIVVYLGWWMFHLLPRRAFPDSAAYASFFQEVQARIGRHS